jgi:hypothetical protein
MKITAMTISPRHHGRNANELVRHELEQAVRKRNATRKPNFVLDAV